MPISSKPIKPYKHAKDVDPSIVLELARMCATMDEMATVTGLCKDTLTNHFSDLIKLGVSEGKVSVRRMQFKAAKEGNTAMLIWLGKQLLGQTERVLNASGQGTIKLIIGEDVREPIDTEVNANGL